MSVTKCIITVKIVSDIEVEFASVKSFCNVLKSWQFGKMANWECGF